MNLKYVPHQASYEVSLFSECPFFSEQKSTLTYDIQVKHIKTEGQENLIEVSKSNVLMNGEEVHDAFNDILLMTGEALSKVIVRIDIQGKILGLVNHDEINKKWIQVRKTVESMYQGHIVAAYLDSMQSKLETAETLWKALSKSFFYTVFFNGIYHNYENMLSIQAQVIVQDLLPTQDIAVSIDKTIILNSETDGYLINLKGKEHFDGFDQSTKDFFKQNIQIETMPDTCFVELEGSYSIHPKNGSINSITMEAKVTIKGIYQKMMQIDVIRLAD